jgi:hypothetical protein
MGHVLYTLTCLGDHERSVSTRKLTRMALESHTHSTRRSEVDIIICKMMHYERTYETFITYYDDHVLD